MIKKIIVSVCLFFSLASLAQEGTSSPYSFFGIGDVRFKGTTEMRSMAGIGVEQDSIHINLDNPASFAGLKLTTFAVGGSYNTNQLKTTSESASTRRSTFDYLAVGLPIGKFGLGFGIIPYSSVGYKIESISQNSTENSVRLDGKGGVNKVFVGLGYKINPKWSIGADAHYSFGKIETTSLEFKSGIPIGTREFNNADLSGINFNIGLMYQTKINTKLNAYTSFNYAIESKLKSVTTRNISTVQYDSNFNLLTIDAADELVTPTTLKFPTNLTFGAGLGESRKWLVGAQVSVRAAATIASAYNSLNNVSYEGAQKISIGGYFIPNFNSFTSYFKRVVYRAGLRYEKTGLVVNSQSIKDFGLTLGLGFPVTGSFSNVNFGFEIGKKGTTSSNLVQENYANFSMSLSLNDKWFEKRKFN
jgi:long-subunit fatty acid transport protein